MDIDSNLNLQDAIRYNRKIREKGYLSSLRDTEAIPCLKIQVNLNKRIVPMASAEAKDQYLDLEDFKSDRPRPQRDLFSAAEPSPL